MKKILFFILFSPLLTFSQKSYEVPFIDGKVQFETVFEEKGKTAKELYSSIKLMVSEIYKSGKAATDVADDDGLFIVVKGITYYPLKDWLGTMQQKLEHTIKFQFKDERIKVTFSNLVVHTVPFECIAAECKGYKYPPKIRQEHIKQVNIIWNELQETIIAKINKANNDIW